MGKQEHIAKQTPLPDASFTGEGCSKGHPQQKMEWKTCSPKPCVSGRAEEACGLLLCGGDIPSPCKKVLQQSRASYIGPFYAVSDSDLCWLCEVLVKGRGGVCWVGRVSCHRVRWALAGVWPTCAVLLDCRWHADGSVSCVCLSQPSARWSMRAVCCFSGSPPIWQLLLFWCNLLFSQILAYKKTPFSCQLVHNFLDSYAESLLKTVWRATLGQTQCLSDSVSLPLP